MPRGLANLVQQSSDYGQFSFIGANREQSRGHIETLKQAFEEVGNLTKVQPILVNDQYQIIDGQHRFTACMELGLPIYFTMVSGLGVREARSMNILHRNWRVDDYARSYAEEGNPNYIKYLELKEDYGFSHSVLLAYIHNVIERSGGFKQFREGDLKIEDEPGIRARLDLLASIGEYTTLVNNREFALAILRASKVEGYDHRRMLKKVRLHGEAMLKRYGSIDDNLRQLEAIYNYAMPEANRLRLY